MWMLIAKGVIAGVVVVLVTKVSDAQPRIGALLLTLPLVSILAFLSKWHESPRMEPITALARETLVLVPLGLGFFVPFAWAKAWGLGFWAAFGLGVVLASITIGLWFWLGPKL
ncbi:MAG: hypothetical protein ACYTGG_04960 [Planctomycetota bacterium]|jgi:hypothetical protein